MRVDRWRQHGFELWTHGFPIKFLTFSKGHVESVEVNFLCATRRQAARENEIQACASQAFINLVDWVRGEAMYDSRVGGRAGALLKSDRVQQVCPV